MNLEPLPMAIYNRSEEYVLQITLWQTANWHHLVGTFQKLIQNLIWNQMNVEPDPCCLCQHIALIFILNLLGPEVEHVINF